jgi:Phage integrase family
MRMLGAGDGFRPCVYATDPAKPIGDWKEAWKAAKERAKVICRFHDLRHTACTRMLEGGVPFSVVATIMAWSPTTAVRMARRYGHIGQAEQRKAVKHLKGTDSLKGGAQNWAQFQANRFVASTNSLKGLAPRPGLEPGTLRLTAECSTIELPRNRRASIGSVPRVQLDFSFIAQGGKFRQRTCKSRLLWQPAAMLQGGAKEIDWTNAVESGS